MIRMNDIYFKVNSKLVERGYNFVGVDKKLKLLDDTLKQYLVEKINELQTKPIILEDNDESITVYDLVTILGELIPKNEHLNTLDKLTHYILDVAGTLQGFSITWEANAELGNIRADIKNGIWVTLDSNKDEDSVKTFHFVYDILQNQMIKNKTPKIG